MLVENPQFTVSDGTTFDLKPVAPLLINRVSIEWEKRNPKPKPPAKEVTLIDKKVLEPDTKNEFYQSELTDWSNRKQNHEMNFYLLWGVKNNPPDEWSLDPDLFGKPSENERKVTWIESHLLTLQDIEGLSSAIVSLTQPTQEAIEESQKN